MFKVVETVMNLHRFSLAKKDSQLKFFLKEKEGHVCLLEESPFYIFRVRRNLFQLSSI